MPIQACPDPSHLRDTTSQEASKCSCEGSGREEKRHTKAAFVSAVPEGDVPRDAREEAALCKSQSHPNDEQTGEVGDKSHERHTCGKVSMQQYNV